MAAIDSTGADAAAKPRNGVAEAAAASQDMTSCSTCRKPVPTARLETHEAFCRRNNTVCLICDEVVPKAKFGQHWHCGLCVEIPYTASSMAARAKHLALYHSEMKCDCETTLEMRAMMQHKSTECRLREVCFALSL